MIFRLLSMLVPLHISICFSSFGRVSLCHVYFAFKITIKNRFAFFFSFSYRTIIHFFVTKRRCASNAFVTIVMSLSVVEHRRQHRPITSFIARAVKKCIARTHEHRFLAMIKPKKNGNSIWMNGVPIFRLPCPRLVVKSYFIDLYYGFISFVTARFNNFDRSKCIKIQCIAIQSETVDASK